MAITTIMHHTSRPRRSKAAEPLFVVGQAVRLKGEFGRLALSGSVYHITRTLPATGGVPQYRIHSHSEGHERVMPQDNLEPVLSSPSRTDLADKVFGVAKP